MTLDLLDRTAYVAVAITADALADVAGTELTFLGWRTLVILGESPDSMRLKDLAERLRISLPSASKLVRRMERRGLLELRPNPNDGRGLLVGMAPEGARIRKAVTDRRRGRIAQSLCEPVPEGFDAALEGILGRLDR